MTDFDVCYFFPSVKIDKEESHFYIVFLQNDALSCTNLLIMSHSIRIYMNMLQILKRFLWLEVI